MRTATNHLGHAVQRFDGPQIGWFAITETLPTPKLAVLALAMMRRTPGAEYRVYPVVSQKGE